jgi:hypothetical protein
MTTETVSQPRVATLAEVALKQRADARAALVAACWRGVTDGELLNRAADAGMKPDEADALVAEIIAVKTDLAAIRTLPGLKLDLKKAGVELERLCAEMDAQRRLADAADEAFGVGGAKVAAVQRDIDEADRATRRVLEASTRGLVPGGFMPREVFALRDRDTAGADKLALHKRWAGAKACVVSCKSSVLDGECRALSDKKMTEVRNDLAVAEVALKEAVGAALKGGCEIPDC